MTKQRSLIHDDFLDTLRFFETRESGTAVEHDLARIARSIYELTSWHQPVIDFVNAEGQRALETEK